MSTDLNTRNPLVSTIIATHNRSKLLPLAVNSILSQTFQDFEIIIVDDASTDDTPRVIEELKHEDDRIRSYCLKENCGPGFARNLGISHAVGKYIAIMDDDDISDPRRFEKQITFFEMHPEVMVVGTFMHKIDEQGKKIGEISYPLKNNQIRWLLFFRCSVADASTMIRKELFHSHGFAYPESQRIGLDWILFLDVIQRHKIENLPDFLFSYRRYPDSMTMKDPELELSSIAGIVINEVKRNSGIDLPKSLVPCFIRPRLVKNSNDGLIISRITKELYKVALTWNLSSEDKRFISENAASRIRQAWQTLNYPLNLLPYVLYTLWIDPMVIFRGISRPFKRNIGHDRNIS